MKAVSCESPNNEERLPNQKPNSWWREMRHRKVKRECGRVSVYIYLSDHPLNVKPFKNSKYKSGP
jgi:hypothetical protein